MKYSDKVTSSWLCPIKGLYFPKWNSNLFKLICYQNSDGQPMLLTNESIKLTRVTEPYMWPLYKVIGLLLINVKKTIDGARSMALFVPGANFGMLV